LSDIDAIVVGAGHNGLTCAAYLGMAGLRVRVFERQSPGRWLLSSATLPEDAVEIPSAGCRLRLADLYEKLTFSDPDSGLGRMRPVHP